MQTNTSESYRSGIMSALGAYIIWGVLPVYWKLLDSVPAAELLAYRIVWSFLFMVAILLVTSRMGAFRDDCRMILANRKKTVGVLCAAILITANWLIFIWAVNDKRIVETSLGYYINPLLSVLVGVVIFKEKLSFWQIIAFFLASAGVLHMAIQLGSLPWVALVLATTFTLYGICKKLLRIGAITSITLETLLASPFCLAYIIFTEQQGSGALATSSWQTIAMLIGTGAVSAIPLLLFSNSANRLPLNIIGFLQYLSPTISLIIGVYWYHESFTSTHWISFSCIWLALLLFSLSKTKPLVELEARLMGKTVTTA